MPAKSYHNMTLEQVSNQFLLEKKINDLHLFKLKINPQDSYCSLACSYHGINLHFKTKSINFINSIKKLIPESWIIHSKDEPIIYLMTPEEFGHTQELWCDESLPECISLENNTIGIQRDFAAKVGASEVFLICESRVADGFYNFLRWYLSEKLIDINKFVVHSSCVLDKNNMAHLFLGHSDAGKTTITELSYPRLVLGDDMNIISLENNMLFVEAGAIGGKFNSMIGYDRKMPVKACYWLHQDCLNERIGLSSTIANQKLVASFANLNWPTLSQKKTEKLLIFSSQASSLMNFYQLNFLNSSTVWDFLDP